MMVPVFALALNLPPREGLQGAGLTVILETRYGFPIFTTGSLLGAMAGSTLFSHIRQHWHMPLLNNFVLPYY